MALVHAGDAQHLPSCLTFLEKGCFGEKVITGSGKQNPRTILKGTADFISYPKET